MRGQGGDLLRRRLRLIALALLLSVLSWPRSATAAPQPERAWEHARALVEDIGPRPAGSDAVARATDYVRARLLAEGLAIESIPVGTVVAPDIVVGGAVVIPSRTISVPDETLLVRLPDDAGATAPAILFMAHLDTVEGSPGAVDNGVAVGVLLELVRALVQAPSRPHPVMIAFTAAEEPGLAGARTLAQALPPGEVALAVSLDLVGAAGPLAFNGLSRALGRPWLERLSHAAAQAGIAVEAPLTHQVVSRALPQLERSDHGAFTERGVPAMHIFHRGPGQIYLEYHSPADTLAHVDAASQRAALAWVWALATDPAPLPSGAGPGATFLPIGGATLVPNGLLWTLELGALVVLVFALHAARRRTGPTAGRWRGAASFAGALVGAWLLAAAIEWTVGAASHHSQPWIHAPGRNAMTMVLATAALLTAACQPWLHEGRARAALPIAMVLAALPGAALLWFEIVELAWVPLAMALAIAALLRCDNGTRRALALGLALLPAWAVLDPLRLREASFHGFLGRGVPLSLLLAVVLLPCAFAWLHVLAAWRPSPALRRGALVLAGVLWLLQLLSGLLVAPRCSGEAWSRRGLACEQPAEAAAGVATTP